MLLPVKEISMRSLLFFTFFFAAVPTARAEQLSPAGELNRAYEQIRATVAADKGKIPEREINEKLRVIIEPLFDFRELSRRCLGSFWKVATPSQQNEFVERFSDLLAWTYLKHITRGVELVQVEKIEEKIQGNKAVVSAVVTVKDLVISSEAKMLRELSGWKVYDVSVENIGLVGIYREEFPPIIRREGFDGLIKRLKEKQEQRRAKALAESK